MKLINSISRIVLAAFLTGFLCTGCTKELNEEPFNSISDVAAFSTPERIDKASIGMYNQLQNANYFGGRVLIYADVRGIDASPSTFFGNVALYSTLTAADATVASAWQGAYRTIYEANLFYKKFLPFAANVSVAKQDQYLGEVKFIRSLCYFYLVNLWAQPYSFTVDASHAGIPLVLEAADDPFGASNNIARSTVKQVYDQMESDLLDAEIKLPATYPDAYSRITRATKNAARALLMRMYLYKGDYTKASLYANMLIGAGYSLNSAPETAFRNYLTNESIFSIPHDGGDNPNTNNALGQHYGATKRADISVLPEYLNLMASTDLRKTNLTVLTSGGATYTTKYNAGTLDWVPVFRYSEVLLTRAEALANLAPGATADPAAILLLNQVRARSNASVLAPATKTDLINAILIERRIELAFEGQGSLDFLRTRRDIPAHSVITAQAWGSNYMVLPMPKYDIDKNPSLVQNPGY